MGKTAGNLICGEMIYAEQEISFPQTTNVEEKKMFGFFHIIDERATQFDTNFYRLLYATSTTDQITNFLSTHFTH